MREKGFIQAIKKIYLAETKVSWQISNLFTGACYDFFYPSTTLKKKHKGGISNVKFSYNTFSK
jgi:hypothetical protein